MAVIHPQDRIAHTPREHAPLHPAKLGQALVALANAENPPVRWAAGTDALGMIEGKIAGLTKELEAWRDLSQSTDGDFSFREEPGAGAWG